jgi:hypothetical protein
MYWHIKNIISPGSVGLILSKHALFLVFQIDYRTVAITILAINLSNPFILFIHLFTSLIFWGCGGELKAHWNICPTQIWQKDRKRTSGLCSHQRHKTYIVGSHPNLSSKDFLSSKFFPTSHTIRIFHFCRDFQHHFVGTLVRKALYKGFTINPFPLDSRLPYLPRPQVDIMENFKGLTAFPHLDPSTSFL